jgi:farnesyl diphosphate synthase
MSSSSSSFFFSTLAIPLALLGAALVPLAKRLAAFADLFFDDFLVQEQAAVLLVLFSIIYGTVTIGISLTSSSSSSSSMAVKQKQYPLDEMANATTDTAKFLCLYPMLRDEILHHLKTEQELNDEAVDWCRNMTDYNVPGGKLNRGTTVLAVAAAFGLTSPVQQARAAVLGWTIEFLQAFFLVADDVMDDSVTRRGQPCWYKQKYVANIAINDAFLLESFCFTILKQHFGSSGQVYHVLVDLILSVTQKTEVGQLLDLTSQKATVDKTVPIDLKRFTMNRYKSIVKYKTAFYSFYLPIAMGIILSAYNDDDDGNTDSRQQPTQHELDEALATARSICCRMGEYFQIQDDYLDCFGDPAVIGKVGTDIQENKCSWMVVQALDRATDQQKKLIQDNYGVFDPAKVDKVKKLYQELKLKDVFEQYEEESYQDIQKDLDFMESNASSSSIRIPRDAFEILLRKIYKRSH